MPPLRKIFQKTQDERGGQRISVAFSMPMLAATLLLLAFAIGWAFFMGFMVGKGQNPQTRINDMTGGLLGEPPKAVPEPEPRQEESPPALAEAPAAAAPPEAAPKAPEPVQPAKRPEGRALNAWGPEEAPQAKAVPAVRKDPPGAVFDYTFQTAAFKGLKDAENLKKKLQAQGLRAQSRKSGKVIVVTVSMRGGEAEVAALREKLRQLKLGSPLQLAKKPVAQNRKEPKRKKKQ